MKDAVQHSESDALTEQFLDTIWLEQNLSENTLASYRLDLQALADWL
ncbi:site-specific tyrosine recombinase XerD, partial [Salmonella enterica subsp. enterica serovar Bareilly]|nr:site-specific tyrosine recombinase XerD [Salmonella enterica subsp. enterica serovar Bareilly]